MRRGIRLSILMPCLFAVFEICHRSHSPLCSLFQIPKPTKIQVKIVQLILSPLLSFGLSFRRSDPELSQDLFLESHTDFMGKCRDSLWKPDSFHGLYGFFSAGWWVGCGPFAAIGSWNFLVPDFCLGKTITSVIG